MRNRLGKVDNSEGEGSLRQEERALGKAKKERDKQGQQM